MIDLRKADEALKSLAEAALAGNRDQVLKQGQLLFNEIDRASKLHYPSYKTGTRTAPPPTYPQYYERYAAIRPHLLNAINHAAMGDMTATVRDIDLAQQALGTVPGA